MNKHLKHAEEMARRQGLCPNSWNWERTVERHLDALTREGAPALAVGVPPLVPVALPFVGLIFLGFVAWKAMRR